MTDVAAVDGAPFCAHQAADVGLAGDFGVHQPHVSHKPACTQVAKKPHVVRRWAVDGQPVDGVPQPVKGAPESGGNADIGANGCEAQALVPCGRAACVNVSAQHEFAAQAVAQGLQAVQAGDDGVGHWSPNAVVM